MVSHPLRCKKTWSLSVGIAFLPCGGGLERPQSSIHGISLFLGLGLGLDLRLGLGLGHGTEILGCLPDWLLVPLAITLGA